MDSKIPMSQKVGIRKRVSGVINTLLQRAFLKYLLLVVVVGVAAFAGMHYYSDLFTNKETGQKKVLHQAGVAGGVALLAAIAAFFTKTL